MTKTKNQSHNPSKLGSPVQSSSLLSFKDIKKKKTAVPWSESEYDLLVLLVRQLGEDWPKISKRLGCKTPKQCMQKFKNSQRSGKKGNWSKEEDELLAAWVFKNGSTKWTDCSKFILDRCGKQCRERWVNILDPQIKKGDWSDEEQEIIFNRLPEFLTSWSHMAGVLSGRTENSIKNYFYSSVRRMKTNPVFDVIKEVYFGKSKSGVLSDEILSEVQKLNMLSRKLSFYLLSEKKAQDGFRDFLNSVVFLPETTQNHEKKGLNDFKTVIFGVPQAPQFTAFNNPIYAINEIDQMNGHLIVPKENLPSGDFKNENMGFLKSQTPHGILEFIRNISESKKCFDFSSFLRFFEVQVENCKVDVRESKIRLRIPNCWNCSIAVKQTHVCGN